MGRHIKTGLDYFPFDIKFFSDIKVRKLIKYQGGKSITIYACLLCNIYEKGYYIVWDNELPFLVSEKTGFEEGYIKEVIKCCFKVELFNNDLYEKHKIITSKGIQERYDAICKLSKRKNQISEFSLINTDDIIIYSDEIAISPEEIVKNSGKSAQSKVKKSKYTTNCISNIYSYPFSKIEDFRELYKKFEFNKKYLFLAYKFWQLWSKENPTFKTMTDAKIDKWYEGIRLIVETDKQEIRRLVGVYCYFEKCAAKESGYDPFWFDTIKSVGAFRKKDKEDIYYLDKILSVVNARIGKDEHFSRYVQEMIKKITE